MNTKSKAHPKILKIEETCKKWSESKAFKKFTLGAIIIASIIVGIETYQNIYTQYKEIFLILEKLIILIFTLEILIRLGAYASQPIEFFKSGWNIFDTVITVIFYVPVAGPFVSVLRLARVLRVLRLLETFPELQILVGALIKSTPSLGYIMVLIAIQFYIFGVIGTFYFSNIAPQYFANLTTSMVTLFKVMTLDGWTTILESVKTVPIAYAYFILFIISGSLIILNLFIGVIMNGFAEVKKEIEDERMRTQTETPTIKNELEIVNRQIQEIERKIQILLERVK